MMDPATLVIGATALQTVGAVVGGEQQARDLNQQADAADANARLSTMQAGAAYAAGAANESQLRRQQAQQLGAQRAAVADSGFDPNSGSALDVQQASAYGAEMDALQKRYEGLLTGYGYESQARQERYQARALRSSATGARRAGYITAAATLLGGTAAAKSLAAGNAGIKASNSFVGGGNALPYIPSP